MKYTDRLFLACLFIFSIAPSATMLKLTQSTNSQVQAVDSPAAEEVVAPQAGQTDDIKSIPAPVVKKTEKQEIIDLIVEVFGEDAPDAFSILYCENRSLSPNAVNHNRNGSRDLGVFQLNDRYHGGEENFNPETNVRKAYKIFSKKGWSPWACSERVGVKPFWK